MKWRTTTLKLVTETGAAGRHCLKGMTLLVLALLVAANGHAQCGSSGDPIVNITFGTADNPDFGDGSTTYRHRPVGMLDNGDYKLASDINHGRPEWHNLRDHTGDTAGMMLLVNASFGAGEFYRIRVSGLCQYTRFRFSAWVANANRPDNCEDLVIPNVRFVIEDRNGNIVNAPYATGDIEASWSPQWLPYGFEFDTGNQTEFDLVLINDNPGGCGNDLAIDDIQFTPCGPPIELNMDEALKQADTLFFCDENTEPLVLSGSITADDSYAAEPVFQWQTRQGEGTPWADIDGERNEELTVMPIHNQWYRLTAAGSVSNLGNALCRISSDSVRFAQLAPQADATVVDERGPVCEDEFIPLNPPAYTGTGAGPITYQWQLDDGNGREDINEATSLAYEFHPAGAGVFRLIRQAINGCGYAFDTHIFEIEVPETIRTALTLGQSEVCADDGPLPLAGGEIVNGDAGVIGVYSGNGVVDGVFYPAIAGVGQHTITFSPPPEAGCPSSSQAIITVHDTIYLEPMLDVILLQGHTVTLRPQTDASQFSWSNAPGLDNYNTPNPVASPVETTTYAVTASNAFGCEKTERVTITVLNDLVVPNSFTPNGDNINDTWEITGLGNYPDVFLQVFNRWGTLVYASKGYAVPWNGHHNGKPLPTGTYYYTLSSDILVQPLSGSVSILR